MSEQGVEFITVTGRRIWLKPVDGNRERQVLRTMKDTKAAAKVPSDVLRGCLLRADPAIENYDELLIGEETDMLLCLRLLTFGPIFKVKATCPARPSGHMHDYQANLRTCRRDIQCCADPACPCHDLYARHCCIEPERELDWLQDEVLTADWSEIPRDHLLVAPPVYRWKLPMSGAEAIVGFQRVKDKQPLGVMAQKLDERIMDATLARSLFSLNGEVKPGLIAKWVEALDLIDKAWLREEIERVEPNVDQAISLTCETCGLNFSDTVPFGAQLFISSSAVFPTWFLALRRSVQEIGTSPSGNSWTGPSKSEGASSQSMSVIESR